ncbi:hypothetical protein DEU56DRAFT_801921 [Suillus clintonianus]|uniref:uncharacterized protein n=1 Tax=Suillus clintonianus TaxID=1904413 RepID=UPI001B87767D|nr:uncharacterized protein DEU56DRAFT_801921 [Suillus clintonianus]KAG2138481.1 hypothetical protein DEU56DRAFT_801921 [Suillus clintonianus]
MLAPTLRFALIQSSVLLLLPGALWFTSSWFELSPAFASPEVWDSWAETLDDLPLRIVVNSSRRFVESVCSEVTRIRSSSYIICLEALFAAVLTASAKRIYISIF